MTTNSSTEPLLLINEGASSTTTDRPNSCGSSNTQLLSHQALPPQQRSRKYSLASTTIETMRLGVFSAVTLLSLAATATPADWKPAAGPLMTRWSKDVSPTNVHAEYPRPQMVRDKWTNLNGLWDYAVRPHKPEAQASGPAANAVSVPEKWDGQILVPFPIESALSGVMQRVGTTDQLVYHRTFKAPQLNDGRRLLLHFGAVDWQCTVSVNGKKVGEHTGGYDPFTFDITDALDKSKSDQELIVSVAEPADANWQPRGKQVKKPHGI